MRSVDTMFARATSSIASTTRATGQVLVMFVLFLLVLLGVSALAIDYASWLLTDRALQNVADHAALAGASQFEQRETQGDCGSGSAAKCQTARVQAWASLNNDLKLGMSDTLIGCLAFVGDSPAGGDVDTSRVSPACTVESASFGHTIWVTTPPPAYAAYTGVGGRYSSNYGVVFVRVDREVRAFLSGVFGVTPDPRHGWATAGAIPTDFALEIFCRDAAEPYQNCRNDGLSIAGGGNNASGIRLVRGDIGSNESLQLTSQQNRGVIVEAGNVFLVNGSCHPSSWNCPVSPAIPGGIADEDPTAVGNTAIMKNAFYIPPIPVPQFASPVTGTIESATCAGSSASNLCVPSKGVYECFSPTGGTFPRCGLPSVDSSTNPPTISCIGVDGGVAGLHFYAASVSNGNSNITPDAAHPQANGNKYFNIAPDSLNTGSPDDDYVNGDGDTLANPANPSNDFVYTGDLNVTNGNATPSTSFTISFQAAGNRQAGSSTVRYTAFKVDGGVANNTLNPVTLQVALLNGAGTTIVADPTVRDLTDVPQRFEFNVGAGLITNYNSLQLRFTFTSTGSTAAADERGGAIAWAGIEHPDPQPPTPPMIPPGYYQGIEIANDGCAVLDPTAEYSALLDWQMPGIYRFGGDNSNNTRLELGTNAYLIGDGVTLVFDPPCAQVPGSVNCWPDSGSQRGLALGADSGLVLNTATTANAAGVTPCTPYEEFGPYNPSDPLSVLPFSALCAAWAFDPATTSGIRPGLASWPACDLANPDSGSHCIERSSYSPGAGYRGITFYFTPAAWPPSAISNRFEMQGGASGLAFRGVLYAPYDDVAISGKNGFDTVGQVLAWTAKFHGGNATIDLDYPYEYVDAKPYLLEPTVGT
jgi:Putative Flp pilus-assembly TadE/G-like